MNTDPLADLLTRIRNAAVAKHPAVTVPASRPKKKILELLVEEGYLARVEPLNDATGKPVLKIYLRYTERGEPVLREIKRVSKPGRRVYVKKDEIPRYRGGLGMHIVSTPKGMLSDVQARKQQLGGELICSIF